MGVEFVQHGNFDKTDKYFKSLMNKDYLAILDKYGRLGVDALRSATPIDTGLAARSWDYVIEQDNGQTRLVWTNDDIESGVSVVIMVDRGHCSRSGTWVPGAHFINKAISPIIAQIAKEVAV